jgi:hypothetical protein
MTDLQTGDPPESRPSAVAVPVTEIGAPDVASARVSALMYREQRWAGQMIQGAAS